jgi:hypothetical protein
MVSIQHNYEKIALENTEYLTKVIFAFNEAFIQTYDLFIQSDLSFTYNFSALKRITKSFLLASVTSEDLTAFGILVKNIYTLDCPSIYFIYVKKRITKIKPRIFSHFETKIKDFIAEEALFLNQNLDELYQKSFEETIQ